MGRHTQSHYIEQVILAHKSLPQFLIECYGVNKLPGPHLHLFPSSLWACPSLTSCFLLSCKPIPILCFEFTNRMSLCETLFPFLCFKFTNRKNPHKNPRHPALLLFAWTSQFCKPYGYQLLYKQSVAIARKLITKASWL